MRADSVVDRGYQTFWRGEGLTNIAVVALTMSTALAIAWLPLSLAAILVIGITLSLLVLIRLEFGFWLLLFAVPFASLKEVELAGFQLNAMEPLVILLVVSWLARMVAEREIHLIAPPLFIPLLLLIAALTISVGQAVSLAASLKEMLKWLELLAVYFLLSNTLKDRGQLSRILVVLLAAGSLEALVGFYQFFGQVGPPSFALGRFMRAYGTFAQPNPFAGYLGMIIPIALSLALLSLRRTTAARSWPSPLRLLSWIGLVLLGGAVMMSLSRGAWLGLAGAVVLMSALASRRTFILLLIALLLLAIVLMLGAFNLLPAQLLQRIESITSSLSIFDARQVLLTPQNWAVVERMAHWQAAWEMFQTNPLFGVGVGNYVIVYPHYALPGWADPLGHAHNFYLNMAAEAGLLGLGAYLLFVVSCFWHAWRVLGRYVVSSDYSLERATLLGLLGALAVVSLHNGFDNLYVHGMNVQIAIMLGMVSALGLRVRSDRLEEGSTGPFSERDC
ncbi:MAG: O-antigen ligase family protein [Chloroflexi bacterium]|nr:O-antigen ligase family protein [Chloroflexota bacterium]MCL5074134.1 O-antigen ligase family protein [Chloroflexota bacterium]